MSTVKVKICYGSIKNPMVVVNNCVCGTCYSNAEIEIPEYLEIAKNYSDLIVIGYNDSFYPIDDVIFYSDNSKKIYLNNVWEIPDKSDTIPLITKIETDTHYSN
ncbi:MAG: hypothetical protein ACI4IS_02950 [Acutalibacteraceae bacterium]